MSGHAMHLYRCDPQSGAGNCICGHPERAWRHPHKFTRVRGPVVADLSDRIAEVLREHRYLPIGECSCGHDSVEADPDCAH